MTTLANTNMCELYFEHKMLTRIADKPMFVSLHQLILQLNTGTSSIFTTLGGGTHGYVGIILTPSPHMDATMALMTPFVIPVHLYPLTITLPATQ